MSLFQRPDRISDRLYVVTTIFNPQRYRSRWKLYEDFAQRCEQAGAVLYTAEVAYGARSFALPVTDPERHLQVRTTHEFWAKENVLNALVRRLPADWRYLAWIDADVRFLRDDWADETLHQLQHYAVVQMWSEAIDLSSDHDVAQRFRSFVWCYRNEDMPGVPMLRAQPYYYADGASPATAGRLSYWHPGYAWAIRRETFDALGGLIDWLIVGNADHYMAQAMIGRIRSLPRSFSVGGRRWMLAWQERAAAHINGRIGYMPGTLAHHWHGTKISRRYQERDEILVQNRFDPERDLSRDWQGLWQLSDRNPGLRDGLQEYFRVRSEDAL